MNSKEIVDIIQASRKVVPVGGRSKPGCLCDLPEGVTTIDMTRLAGIVAYDPDEYTLTAQAGTPLQTLIEAVEAHGQYLPFDPLFAQQGGTIGGTVAANVSGSGRFRYGGVRDFILGIRFVDGQGNVVRGGGNVVKNASGFDLPKFMVGSLGRYGVLTEVTLKVFPKPAAYQTLRLEFASLAAALNGTFALANQPFEMDALDFWRTQRDKPATTMVIRLGGLAASLPGRIERLSRWLTDETELQTIQAVSGGDEADLWDQISRIDWAADGQNLVKVPVAPKQLSRLDAVEAITGAHYFSAGNVALVTTDDLDRLSDSLTEQGLIGLVLRGNAPHPHLGTRFWVSLAQRVQRALDPDGKFLDV